jgi:signal transduction histidine kinase
VARWSAVGLAAPAAVGVVVVLANPDSLLRTVVPGIFVNLVAVGGVAGLLVGLVLEMHREQSDLRRLNQRNKVLNRVLRHNIRNDMSVMQLHIDLLDEEAQSNVEESLDALRRKIQEVVSTSDTARRIDQLEAGSVSDGPVDVVELVEERVRIVRTTHPEVTVNLDLPGEAWAAVGPVFESAIDNVVENAINHHDGVPSIDVTVERLHGGDSPIRISITDDGPGIPASEVELLGNGTETQLEHATGLGLWLVKWVVDYYDGELRIETPASGGTRVVLELPPAPDPATGRKAAPKAHPTR